MSPSHWGRSSHRHWPQRTDLHRAMHFGKCPRHYCISCVPEKIQEHRRQLETQSRLGLSREDRAGEGVFGEFRGLLVQQGPVVVGAGWAVGSRPRSSPVRLPWSRGRRGAGRAGSLEHTAWTCLSLLNHITVAVPWPLSALPFSSVK